MHLIFGSGRTFKGDVGRWALSRTPYDLNPELTAPDPQLDAAANRQQQRDQAVYNRSVATNMIESAAGLEAAVTSNMNALMGMLEKPRPARALSRLAPFAAVMQCLHIANALPFFPVACAGLNNCNSWLVCAVAKRTQGSNNNA